MATVPASPWAKPTVVIWQAPLVFVALALTTGIVVDRFWPIPLSTSLAVAAAFLLAWLMAQRNQWQQRAAPSLLWFNIAACGAAYHQWHCASIAANDIRLLATTEGRIARLRGVVHSEPIHTKKITNAPLRTSPASSTTRILIAAQQLENRNDWREVTGLIQATLLKKRNDFHVGDELELVGKLALPEPAANPGGFDYAAFLRDQRIGATLLVKDAAGAVVVVHEGWPRTLSGWLAVIRGRGVKLLEDHLPEKQRGVAAALLLGDGSGMSSDDWDGYLRTGVIHVLAISGQHLVILSHFLWVFFRLCRFGQKPAALTISVLLLAYALMTGARPPIMRAAWMAIAFTAAIFLRRMVLPANSFALAWIGVIAANPTSIFDNGCQLSFLAVGVLICGTFQLSHFSIDVLSGSTQQSPAESAEAKREEQSRLAMEKLIEESRTPLERRVRGMFQGTGRQLWTIAVIYLENALIWLVITPLIASRNHMISPIAILIGPPVVLLSTYALLFGFVFLLAGFLGLPLLGVFATPVRLCLAGCDYCVNWGLWMPGAFTFAVDLPSWWLGIFYAGAIIYFTIDVVRRHGRWQIMACLAWLILGCVLALSHGGPSAFRCTFLAIGHGGCTVLELPNGRVILYDAGAITGPDVTRRVIAPFLWNRGFRRIDEVIISHGDLDHFNGLPPLMDRFAIGQVTLTPTFADHTTPGVAFATLALEKKGLTTRIAHAPMRWNVGDVQFEALHPPARGPEGKENARSLVLAVRHQGVTLLLTGDLEDAGLERVLKLRTFPVDVLMAPHHGSTRANTKELATWARPQFVVSCQGPPKSVPKEPNPYEALGARWLSTWSQGAVTIRHDDDTWIVETHVTKNRWAIQR